MRLDEDDIEVGQKVAAGVEPNWYRRRDRSGEMRWAREIVYCRTDKLEWRSENNPEGHRCKEFGGFASWERCSRCTENWGFYTMTHRGEYPEPSEDQCLTGDLRYQPERPECRECYQRAQCVGYNVRRSSKIRLTVLP